MGWDNVNLYLLILLHMWICSQASLVVDVNCWWNQALPVVENVAVVCNTSAQGSTDRCELCQLYIIMHEQTHYLPSACANTIKTIHIPVASEHLVNIDCKLVCQDNKDEPCRVTGRGGYPPFPPSRPDCSIEDLEEGDIHCSWERSNEPMIPTIYILHWQDCDENVNSRESDSENGVIKRAEYMKNTDIGVWVTAKNLLGSAQSEVSVFNTGYITRPDAPYITNHTSQPLEIFWEMDCEMLSFSDIKCQVQYHALEDKDWTEVDDYQVTFLLEEPQPFTEYKFRVRCHCGEEEVMSHWSTVYSVRTPPAAPTGQLDVWTDCAPNSNTSSCNVFWKEMPPSQAKGEVNYYVVTLKLDNGKENKLVTRQRRDTDSQHPDENGCHQLRHFPLQPGVKGVFVSANTSMGMSDPTFMAFPVMAQTTPEVNLSVMGENHKLFVTWSEPSQFSESLLEYVVQHMSVELPHTPCLNWVKVNRTQRSVTLTGEFRNYTAYNVSLFAVINNHSTFLKSAIAYTLQGVPPEVPQFHVKNISHSSVTLMWIPIPVHESNGVILQYSVGLNETKKVLTKSKISGVNVSSDRTSVQLLELQPAQQYHAWVSAVTSTGEGVRSITTFSTTDEPGYVTPVLLAIIILLPLFILILLFAFVFLLWTLSPTWCFPKIPDPLNSKSFKHANFQHVWPGYCSTSESSLKISELEILENLAPTTPTHPSETELVDEEPHQKQRDGIQRLESEKSKSGSVSEHGGWTKDYSEVVDTDEEEEGGDGEEEKDEDWVEQNCVSDYERHFMPS
ncbi:interleukin-12 receptor subunit beta-2-like isoform X1 [Myxocyprinus asiaticus]|uniref:interleukin-12 receptor subunit beta-2-like isoform X1 n=1 Tax=Myxocyprinus asiaticus TaxID=70543 RepID=UPI0022216079|nr:interleukin-12 receptor subunit beta-2-like isoform X1 [Myxocyprinus asiaticus]